MPRIMETLRSQSKNLVRVLPVLAFLIPFLILYYWYPASFEATWKGRTYYLFFLWILSLEIILDWEKLEPKCHKLKSLRTVVLLATISLPTIYIVAADYTGFNQFIVDISPRHASPGNPADPFWAKLMPLTAEYLIFTLLFVGIVLVEYGRKGLWDFSLAPCLIGAIGLIYLTDNLYPYEQFAPLQIFVPWTAGYAEKILNLIGYQTRLAIGGGITYLWAQNSAGGWGARIAWPCSGVESLIIYTLTIALFLGKTSISWPKRIVYFAVGAVVTYTINVLRIVTIFVIAINDGDWVRFHDYYGQLYSITWIMVYPLIIIGSRALWGRIRSRRSDQQLKEVAPTKDLTDNR